MGVTIHFEGRLRDESAYLDCVNVARQFAEDRGWVVGIIPDSERILQRVKNEEVRYHRCVPRGIEVLPHPNSEPLRLEFDDALFMQEFCKTQFAPIETHMEIVHLLHTLSPHFLALTVVDEGEYYHSSDQSRLAELRNNFFHALHQHLASHPGSRGPVRLRSGRIADVVS